MGRFVLTWGDSLCVPLSAVVQIRGGSWSVASAYRETVGRSCYASEASTKEEEGFEGAERLFHDILRVTGQSIFRCCHGLRVSRRSIRASTCRSEYLLGLLVSTN